MKQRTGNPWMSGADYGRTLSGLSINLLVREVNRAMRFAREVLGAQIVYSDADFAVLQACGAEWMLHADHCYDQHPLFARVSAPCDRGVGVELRLHGRDPDAAESAARQLGYTVLQTATDKRHGLREVYLVDDDGYLWVADTILKA